MDRIKLTRTGRLFPANLYNKLEQKLRNKTEDTVIGTGTVIVHHAIFKLDA